ncbi:hypothetical protein KIM372_11820 [Bombiscardovia nodaiensis]|uniref:UDP-N-acetylmuramyl peptide synthase n=1 Tax=Bombiscardovia nodaiensis TaxID=2932181 RepID=A0ABM8B8N7_9BIFI|nr:hypothetical protein KIM372_11820 [Bombiscardovia nodaiensis]
MSALSESISQRMTLGYLHSHYGLELVPSFAQDVTVTSLADDLNSVRPGSLYLPYLGPGEEHVDLGTPPTQPLQSAAEPINDDTQYSQQTPTQEVEQVQASSSSTESVSEPEGDQETSLDHLLVQAELRGAYAVLLPQSVKKAGIPQADIPLLIGDLEANELGQILSNAAGGPSSALAIFALVGQDASEQAEELAEFLHMLGNPVGVLSAHKVSSLERSLDVQAPMSMFDVQRSLAICLEDGAAAVVIAVDSATLQAQALQSVQVDVIAFPKAASQRTHFYEGRRGRLTAAAREYGFALSSQMQVARPSDTTDEMAQQALAGKDQSRIDALSLNIAMTLAAGVKRSHIRSALETNQELS